MAKRSRKKAKRDAELKAADPNRVILKRVRPSGNQSPPWIAPDDMPQWQVDLVKAGKMCGARVAGTDRYCTMKPTPHQEALGRPLPHRCNYHGGAVPTYCLPPEKRKPNLKHGLYSECLLPGEEEVYEKLLKQGDDLSEEIAMCKMRLMRAIKAEADQHALLAQGGYDDAYEPFEQTKQTTVDVTGMSEVRVTKRRRIVDFGRRVHAITLELAKLYQQRALMNGDDLDADDKARLVREAVKEAKKSVGISSSDDE